MSEFNVKSSLSTSERKILAAVRENPGLLWYEAGEKAYPASTVPRLNLWGESFHELVGRAVGLTHKAIGTLEGRGLIHKDEQHRFRATPP